MSFLSSLELSLTAQDTHGVLSDLLKECMASESSCVRAKCTKYPGKCLQGMKITSRQDAEAVGRDQSVHKLIGRIKGIIMCP